MSKSSDVDLTITIASFNSKDVTRETLQSIFEHTKALSFEVIVVDNASEDGSADMISREFPVVKLIRSANNLGFGAAHNLAIQHAQGNYILVLNSDVKFLDNAAKKMIKTLQSWPKAGALGPKILNPDGSYVPSASYRQFPSRFFLGITLLNLFFPFVHYLPIDWIRSRLGFVLGQLHSKFFQPTFAEKVEWVDGVCVLFDRESLRESGLFDEQYFFDMEIGDLLYRIRKRGWDIIYDPRIAIVHLGGYSRKQNPKILRQSIKSMLIYYAKHRPDYVPFMKVLLSGILGVKIHILELTRMSKDEAQLYLQIHKDVKYFCINDAYTNKMIPQLPLE